MGCWAIGGLWTFMDMPAGWGATNDDESIRAVETAFHHGIRLFDTAAVYGCGHSEKLLGKALGSKRKDCVISTKFGYEMDIPAKRVRKPAGSVRTMPVASRLAQEFEASLKRLGTDYIDVYFFHVNDYDLGLARNVMEELEKLAEGGKIRSYGWSTDDAESAGLFAQGPHCSSVQISFSIAVDQKELLSVCEENRLAAFNRGPPAMGFLTGKYDGTTRFPADDVRTRQWAVETFQEPLSTKLDDLRDLLTADGRTLAQGALGYIWARSDRTFPIPGIRTEA
ncbi:MAG: aldo/keto reductase [Spirochaetaceae bacterium]|nr:aldo/keto reductase [Spirochaetaceae bacterium]